MPYTIQPADPDNDADEIARLLTLIESEPITAEVMRDRQRRRTPDAIHRAWLAEPATGAATGYASISRFAYEAAGRFELNVVVEPDRRGQGMGAALYDRAVLEARAHGATVLTAVVRDDDPASLAFGQRRGFTVESHQFEAVLQLADLDPAPHTGRVDAVRAAGIRFFSLAETDGSEEMLRRLYDLNTVAGLDVPGHADGPVRPFEQFSRDVFASYWFRPAGQILAADGERWVGLAAVGEIAPGAMYNMFTGVLRDYRGRGIATALKLLAIDYALRRGAHTLRTNNDSRNAPILAINRTLGYRPEPGWYHLQAAITSPGFS